MFRFPKAAVLKKVQQWGPLPSECNSFFVLLAIHEIESTPFTKAPSKGIGSGSSNAARRAHIELSSSFCKQDEATIENLSMGSNRKRYIHMLDCIEEPDKNILHIPSFALQQVVNRMKQVSD